MSELSSDRTWSPQDALETSDSATSSEEQAYGSQQELQGVPGQTPAAMDENVIHPVYEENVQSNQREDERPVGDDDGVDPTEDDDRMSFETDETIPSIENESSDHGEQPEWMSSTVLNVHPDVAVFETADVKRFAASYIEGITDVPPQGYMRPLGSHQNNGPVDDRILADEGEAILDGWLQSTRANNILSTFFDIDSVEIVLPVADLPKLFLRSDGSFEERCRLTIFRVLDPTKGAARSESSALKSQFKRSQVAVPTHPHPDRLGHFRSGEEGPQHPWQDFFEDMDEERFEELACGGRWAPSSAHKNLRIASVKTAMGEINVFLCLPNLRGISTDPHSLSLLSESEIESLRDEIMGPLFVELRNTTFSHPNSESQRNVLRLCGSRRGFDSIDVDWEMGERFFDILSRRLSCEDVEEHLHDSEMNVRNWSHSYLYVSLKDSKHQTPVEIEASSLLSDTSNGTGRGDEMLKKVERTLRNHLRDSLPGLKKFFPHATVDIGLQIRLRRKITNGHGEDTASLIPTFRPERVEQLNKILSESMGHDTAVKNYKTWGISCLNGMQTMRNRVIPPGSTGTNIPGRPSSWRPKPRLPQRLQSSGRDLDAYFSRIQELRPLSLWRKAYSALRRVESKVFKDAGLSFLDLAFLCGFKMYWKEAQSFSARAGGDPDISSAQSVAQLLAIGIVSRMLSRRNRSSQNETIQALAELKKIVANWVEQMDALYNEEGTGNRFVTLRMEITSWCSDSCQHGVRTLARILQGLVSPVESSGPIGGRGLDIADRNLFKSMFWALPVKKTLQVVIGMAEVALSILDMAVRESDGLIQSRSKIGLSTSAHCVGVASMAEISLWELLGSSQEHHSLRLTRFKRILSAARGDGGGVCITPIPKFMLGPVEDEEGMQPRVGFLVPREIAPILTSVELSLWLRGIVEASRRKRKGLNQAFHLQQLRKPISHLQKKISQQEWSSDGDHMSVIVRTASRLLVKLLNLDFAIEVVSWFKRQRVITSAYWELFEDFLGLAGNTPLSTFQPTFDLFENWVPSKRRLEEKLSALGANIQDVMDIVKVGVMPELGRMFTSSSLSAGGGSGHLVVGANRRPLLSEIFWVFALRQVYIWRISSGDQGTSSPQQLGIEVYDLLMRGMRKALKTQSDHVRDSLLGVCQENKLIFMRSTRMRGKLLCCEGMFVQEVHDDLTLEIPWSHRVRGQTGRRPRTSTDVDGLEEKATKLKALARGPRKTGWVAKFDEVREVDLLTLILIRNLRPDVNGESAELEAWPDWDSILSASSPFPWSGLRTRESLREKLTRLKNSRKNQIKDMTMAALQHLIQKGERWLSPSNRKRIRAFIKGELRGNPMTQVARQEMDELLSEDEIPQASQTGLISQSHQVGGQSQGLLEATTAGTRQPQQEEQNTGHVPAEIETVDLTVDSDSSDGSSSQRGQHDATGVDGPDEMDIAAHDDFQFGDRVGYHPETESRRDSSARESMREVRMISELPTGPNGSGAATRDALDALPHEQERLRRGSRDRNAETDLQTDDAGLARERTHSLGYQLPMVQRGAQEGLPALAPPATNILNQPYQEREITELERERCEAENPAPSEPVGDDGTDDDQQRSSCSRIARTLTDIPICQEEQTLQALEGGVLRTVRGFERNAQDTASRSLSPLRRIMTEETQESEGNANDQPLGDPHITPAEEETSLVRQLFDYLGREVDYDHAHEMSDFFEGSFDVRRRHDWSQEPTVGSGQDIGALNVRDQGAMPRESRSITGTTERRLSALLNESLGGGWDGSSRGEGRSESLIPVRHENSQPQPPLADGENSDQGGEIQGPVTDARDDVPGPSEERANDQHMSATLAPERRKRGRPTNFHEDELLLMKYIITRTERDAPRARVDWINIALDPELPWHRTGRTHQELGKKSGYIRSRGGALTEYETIKAERILRDNNAIEDLRRSIRAILWGGRR